MLLDEIFKGRDFHKASEMLVKMKIKDRITPSFFPECEIFLWIVPGLVVESILVTTNYISIEEDITCH